MAKGIFLTGTGTDIGKTYIAGLLVKTLAEAGKRPAYYKAAMSGNDRRPDGSLIPGDGAFVKTFSGIGQSLESMCPYVYEHAWSPHLAARYEGNPPELPVIRQSFERVCSRHGYVTAEGQITQEVEELPGYVQSLYREYELAAYNHLFDEKHHPEDFFSLRK